MSKRRDKDSLTETPLAREHRPFLRESLEYLGGARDAVPGGAPKRMKSVVARCAAWLVLLTIIYFFCGQSSRFIYIDF